MFISSIIFIYFHRFRVYHLIVGGKRLFTITYLFSACVAQLEGKFVTFLLSMGVR